MTVFYKKNGKLAAYDDGMGFIAKPTEEPEIPQGPFDKCTGCPYPRHGFLCWGRDGSCLRTDMEEIYSKGKAVPALC